MKKYTGTIKTATPSKAKIPTAALPAVPEITTQSLTNLLISTKKPDGSQLVDYNQAIALTNIKFSSGEPVLTLNYRYFIYEVINLLSSLDYDIVYNFLSTDWIKVFGNISDIRKKILLENPLLEPAKQKLQMDMEIYRNKLDVGVGVFSCKRCLSKETISLEVQNRSADEQMTVKVTCIHCGYKWRAQ